ncbi:testis-expressed protein 22 [Phocoena sinus]|uniref:testis-expressed protein 22 n=1 Tax=Phocoena sinus TaxID=42100 RepID=UPI0013C4D71D|nr:testis-expressed protein 22 [Phocoena sinus]
MEDNFSTDGGAVGGMVQASVGQLCPARTGQQPEGHDLRGNGPQHPGGRPVHGKAGQVCEPQGSRPPSRRWNVSIDERWRLAVLGGGERPGLAGATLSYRDLAQIVAQLVSQDEDKDVLFPHPPRSAKSSSAFQAFLVRSAPFWHNVTLEAQASRSPPS